MGRPKKGPKDPFDSLGSDFKDAVAQSTREEIEHRIIQVTMYDIELRKQKKEDGHLKECAEAYKDASEIYREGFKANKLKLEFMKRVLDDKGGPTHSPSDADDTAELQN